jgi:hypothetical protein
MSLGDRRDLKSWSGNCSGDRRARACICRVFQAMTMLANNDSAPEIAASYSLVRPRLAPMPPVWMARSRLCTDSPWLRLNALLASYPSDDMIAWPVSARVGDVKNNDSGLIEPIGLT